MKRALIVFSLTLVGWSCEPYLPPRHPIGAPDSYYAMPRGTLPGTVISWGNSYAVDSVDALHDLFGCKTVLLGRRGRLVHHPDWRNPTMIDLLDDHLAILESLEGPVTVVLQLGHGDERLIVPSVGLPRSRAEIADSVTTIVRAILDTRDDVVVFHLPGVEDSTCDFTYNELMPDLASEYEGRYELVSLAATAPAFALYPATHMRDQCHFSAPLGAAKRIATLLLESDLALDSACWEQ